MSTGAAPFVLVHGAYHGGWCWAPVARILRSHGHDVFTPTNTGLGERRHLLSASIDMETFVQDVRNVIEFEQLSSVILVGHSFGGRAVAGVADRIPGKLRRLVFIDAALPLDGRSRLESMPEEARQRRLKASMDHDGGISVPPTPAAQLGIRDAAVAAWVDGLMTPQPLGVEKTALKLDHAIGNGRPVTYVRCIDPPFAIVNAGADYARNRQDWEYVEIQSGHEAIVTHPELVADLLLRVAD